MSIQGGGLPDHCTQCREPLEIVAVSFPFLKPCTAVFSCSSWGLTFSEANEGRKPQNTRVGAPAGEQCRANLDTNRARTSERFGIAAAWPARLSGGRTDRQRNQLAR